MNDDKLEGAVYMNVNDVKLERAFLTSRSNKPWPDRHASPCSTAAATTTANTGTHVTDKALI